MSTGPNTLLRPRRRMVLRPLHALGKGGALQHCYFSSSASGEHGLQSQKRLMQEAAAFQEAGRAQLCMETLGICPGVICSRPPVGFPWSFDTELEAQIAVTQVRTGTQGVKAKPLGVSPKTTHRPVVLREQGSNLHASRDVFIPG